MSSKSNKSFTMLPKVMLAIFATIAVAAPATKVDEARSFDIIDKARSFDAVDEARSFEPIDERDVDAELDDRDLEVELDDRDSAASLEARAETESWGGNGRRVSGRSCPGSPVRGSPFKISGGRGRVHLYYSAANGGTNCAWVDNLTGKPREMAIHLSQTSDYRHFSSNAGNFEKFAGSVRVTKLKGKCITLYAWVEGGRGYESPKNFHYAV